MAEQYQMDLENVKYLYNVKIKFNTVEFPFIYQRVILVAKQLACKLDTSILYAPGWGVTLKQNT